LREIKKQYVVDEENRPIAVQIDLETFREMEEVIENRALFELMTEQSPEEALDIAAARRHYAELESWCS